MAQAGKRHWGYPESWLEAWRAELTISEGYIEQNVVCCAEDEAREVVGFYALQSDGTVVRLEHLWLAPRLIGRGAGRLLFDHAARTAVGRGATELLIESDPNAAGFYLHMGAEHVGSRICGVTGSERAIPRLRYRLPGIAPKTCSGPDR